MYAIEPMAEASEMSRQNMLSAWSPIHLGDHIGIPYLAIVSWTCIYKNAAIKFVVLRASNLLPAAQLRCLLCEHSQLHGSTSRVCK